jgi:hypothetical protein
MHATQSMQSADTEIEINYDEGLVHGHRWASSSTEQTIIQAEQQPQSAWREDTTDGHDEGDGYDDGLVHGHSWASCR